MMGWCLSLKKKLVLLIQYYKVYGSKQIFLYNILFIVFINYVYKLYFDVFFKYGVFFNIVLYLQFQFFNLNILGFMNDFDVLFCGNFGLFLRVKMLEDSVFIDLEGFIYMDIC